MGSKVAMLAGELGGILDQMLEGRDDFVDLFSGAGSVSTYVATKHKVRVASVDLQKSSRALAAAIVERTESLDSSGINARWIEEARKVESSLRSGTFEDVSSEEISFRSVTADRELARVSGRAGFIERHYGGHYFSLAQACALDSLYKTMPRSGAERAVCLAAIVRTASACAAAPGHTAQPFQPTEKLLPFLGAAWSRNPYTIAANEVQTISGLFAHRRGGAHACDAESYIPRIPEGAIVFCDPPYSEVQYSRFYHVLEGIAVGGWSSVSGAGRAPDLHHRAVSQFSLRSGSHSAMKRLLSGLRSRGCSVVMTFPDAMASNGLSADLIAELANGQWRVQNRYVESTHSTLGGSSDGSGRGARKSVKEAVLLLEPA